MALDKELRKDILSFHRDVSVSGGRARVTNRLTNYNVVIVWKTTFVVSL